MSSRYGFLCALSVLAIAILGYENYRIWSSAVDAAPSREAVRNQETMALPPSVTAFAKEISPLESYRVIAERNLFNPDRKEFTVTGQETQGGPKPARPVILLYGVVVGDQFQTASIVNPGRPLQRGERETLTLKIGDAVGNYKLTRILPDRIVMEAGEDSFEVLLRRFPRTQAEMKNQTQTTVISSVPPGGPPVIIAAIASAAAVPRIQAGKTVPAPAPRPDSAKPPQDDD